MAPVQSMTLLLPTPSVEELRALQADLGRAAGHDLSAREMGELLGYQGRGVADKRWREYVAGRPLDAHRWTLLMLQLNRHPDAKVTPR